jgi:hypothetical protein
MQIQNLHQPYIFKHNNEINLIVSEYVDQKLNFKFGDDDVVEDYWKLHHLDSNFNKTIINTPNTIIYDNVQYYVIAECNGYFFNNKLSYVMGLHTKEDHHPMGYLMVMCDFDIENKTTSNLEFIDTVRTGFVNNDKITLNHKTNEILKNDEVILNCEIYLDSVTRIIPVYGQNQILFTGKNNENFETFLFDMDTNNINKINGVNQTNIYKSSIFDDGNTKLFAYTKKVFVGESQVDYVLNIEDDYILINQ